jgi:hypothetical protein
MAIERRSTPVKADGEWQFPVGVPPKAAIRTRNGKQIA